ncbi:hypothetical protein [Trichloromonas sp.]|uniref:hypothetical protein n=1 Tax=Trichloromonas sp. TaxID=3069249 RepID=UPI002A3A8090|nr:hypothetical protein [Trichloromonas sp.]
MFEIVEKPIHIDFLHGHHLHCMICQIPSRMAMRDAACRLVDPEAGWQQLRSILELVREGQGNLKKCHFLTFPEAVMPFARIEEALEIIRAGFRPNSVVMFGIEHMRLSEYRDLLCRYREDNGEALASVEKDLDSGDIEQLPTNVAVTVIKEADGRTRIFLLAKSHPFVGEEHLDAQHDLYRGKVFPLFRCQPACFNFMPVICIDYVYRDVYQSNISVIIEKANQLFFQTRQRLDLLAVLQFNPKPEHRAFRDVVNGFYGEYLAYTPGVRDTITVFCNTSDESSGILGNGTFSFGHSSVVIHKSHKIAPTADTEFEVDDFGGLPVCRLRFGTATRLYYFNLPLFHELDPRTTRVPLKIHGIFRSENGQWRRIEKTGETQT